MKKELVNEIETKDELNQEAEETTAVAPVDEKPKFASKVRNGLKKHGKKLAIGAGVAALGVVGYVLGRKSVLKYADCDVDDIDLDDSGCDDVIETIDIDIIEI